MSWMKRILGVVIIVGGLITIHEFGHFIAAKKTDVGVTRFSIGFGPVLASTYIGETEFALSAIPLGGYVMPVVSGPDDGWTAEELELLKEQHPDTYAMIHDESRWMSNASAAERLFIAVAGPAVNFLFVILCSPLVFRAINRGRITEEPFGLITISKSGFIGPIGLFKIAGLAAEKSGWLALFYAVELSHALGVFNLLPIPLLDGGHAAFAIIDGFKSGEGIGALVAIIAATLLIYLLSKRMRYQLSYLVAFRAQAKRLVDQFMQKVDLGPPSMKLVLVNGEFEIEFQAQDETEDIAVDEDDDRSNPELPPSAR